MFERAEGLRSIMGMGVLFAAAGQCLRERRAAASLLPMGIQERTHVLLQADREWRKLWMRNPRKNPRKTLVKPSQCPRKSPNSPSYIPIQIALIAAPKTVGQH